MKYITCNEKLGEQKLPECNSDSQAWMAEEGGEENLLAIIGADPKQLAEAGELDSPRNSTG